MNPTPYPLLLEPVLLPKVWGGDALARLGKKVRPGERIGESWEVADLASTSASGAGGQAVVSRIVNGPLAGKTLHDAIGLWEDGLLPRGLLTRSGAYPLLVKLLDARQNLSVQVHPSPAYAREHPGAHLKAECWTILEAAPGAVIYKGVKAGVTREAFERALRTGDGGGVVDMLEAVPAAPGECHNLPSGTVHALGAGVVVAEVQTPSDTTYRVYDWGREGRELHVRQALACIEFGPAPQPVVFDRRQPFGGSLATEFFTVAQCTVTDAALPLSRHGGGVVVVVEGKGRLESPGAEAIDLALGSTVLAPAACAGAWALRAGAGAGAGVRVLMAGPREAV